MLAAFRELKRRWLEKWDAAAETIGSSYVTHQFKATDSAMRSAMKDVGWAVDFHLTPAMRDALDASIAENVGLIKSIPQQYLAQVEGIVARSYTVGRDLGTMTKELQALYPMTKRRAQLIARDQSNKLNAVVNRTRALELGLTQAVWIHSGGGKTQRPGHVEAGAKRLVYNVAEGAYLDSRGPGGKPKMGWVWPGTEINCKCVSRPVLPYRQVST